MFGYKIVKINTNYGPAQPEMDLESSVKYTNERIEKLEILVFSLLDHLNLQIPSFYNPLLKLVDKEK